MTDAMSKKEKLARGSAVIKVMKVVPRPGHYLSSYVDVYKLPRKPKPPIVGKPPSMALQEMPHMNIKAAVFDVLPRYAKIDAPRAPTSLAEAGLGDPCAFDMTIEDEPNIQEMGLPEGHYLLKSFGYREWSKTVYPTADANFADHFNGLLGLLITMSIDPENTNFPDVEAYPCVQFLRTIKTPDGEVPQNIASFINYIETICNKIVEES